MNAIPYILLCLFLIFLYLNETRKIKLISVASARKVSFVVLLIFIGLRGHIYSDFVNYYIFFENLPDLFNFTSSAFTDWLFEPGFVLYSSIIKTIVPDYFGWVFVNTLIDLLVFRYVFRRYTASQILPVIFFIAFNGLYIEFNLYRNVKAIDLFLLSLPFLEKRKCLPYMLLNILGTTFHSSSIVFLPLYFILGKEIPRYIRWIGIIIANVIFLLQFGFVSDFLNSLSIFQSMSFYDKLSGHIENSEAGQNISFGYIERTFSILLFTLLYNKLVKQSRSNIIFYNCFWLYYISFLFFYEVQVLVDRIPTLFMFSYWVLYPNVLNLKFKSRQLIYIFSFILVFLKVFLSNSISPAKYDNVLFGIDDYNTRKTIYENFAD